MTTPPLVPSTWQLPDAFRKRLGRTVGRQRVFVEGDQLLIVAHRPPKPGEPAREGVLFWREANGKWKTTSADRAQPIPSLLDAYEKRLDELDQWEAAATQSDQYLQLLDSLSPVVRSLRNFYEVLQEARTAAPQVSELIDLRDRGYELSRRAELLHTDTKNAMDVAVIRRAEEQSTIAARMAQATYRLNRMVALFLPLATLSAIFSTYFTQSWAWLQNPLSFIVFLGIGSLAGLLLLFFISRK